MNASLLHLFRKSLLVALSLADILAVAILPACAQRLPDVSPTAVNSGDAVSNKAFAQQEPLLRSALELQLASLDTAAAGQSEREQLAAVARTRSALGAYLHL